ncbi:MAG: TIGR03915 family putative DNA repair protein [Candidatus Coproplasma sp.]
MTYYITDGSEDCFYTAVFDAYKDEDCIITSSCDVQLGLGCELKEVIADGQKAERVRRKLNLLDTGALNDVKLMLRSCDALKENIAFVYVKLIVKFGGAVRNMQADPRVLEATDLIHKVTGENHRMKGFLRFMENADGVLYAPYSPDNDITDMLAVHFADRLGGQKFVIHDVKRKIAALYDGNEIVMTRVEDAEIYLSEYEKYFEDLWKLYYKSVNILSRPHEKQMKGYMPVRYWKFLPEKRE